MCGVGRLCVPELLQRCSGFRQDLHVDLEKIRFCSLRVSQPCLAIATGFMCTMQTEAFLVLPPSVVRIWVTLFVRSIDSVSKVKIGLGGVDWIRLSQYRDRWRSVVSAVMNFGFLRHGVS
jgi:hypothetical protein